MDIKAPKLDPISFIKLNEKEIDILFHLKSAGIIFLESEWLIFSVNEIATAKITINTQYTMELLAKKKINNNIPILVANPIIKLINTKRDSKLYKKK